MFLKKKYLLQIILILLKWITVYFNNQIIFYEKQNFKV